jgi:hypothetical protein
MSTIGGFDTSALIQVGVTLVIVGGLTYWMHNRMNKMQESMDIMKETLEKHEEIFKTFEQILLQHDGAIKNLYGHPPKNKNAGGAPQNIKIIPPKINKNAQNQKNVPPQKKPKQQTAQVSEEVSEGEDDTAIETGVGNLDDLIKGEIEDLECDAETGECKLPITEIQKKKLKT